MQTYDIVVIGGGPAGLASAIEAKKNGVSSILVIERDKELGGILQQCIHNGFGLHIFKEELTGPEYAQRFIEELKAAEIEYWTDTMVINIDDDKKITIVNASRGLVNIKAKSIILAMGCRERARGAINIPGTRPSGIITAGSAQRFVNMEGYMVGKEIVIFGSGDIGLIMARRLALEGANVKAVIERKPYSSGLTRNIVQCLDDYDIPIKYTHTIVGTVGRERLTGVTIAKVDNRKQPIPGTEEFVSCDTLMLSVGLIPENELSELAGVRIDHITSGAFVNETMETSVPGIFACGNVLHVHDLVDYVTLESRKAGKYAARYVVNGQHRQESYETHENKESKVLKIEVKNGIRYAVPQYIAPEVMEEAVELYMRVDNVYRDVKLVVKLDGQVFKKIKRNHVIPSEMEKVRLEPSDLFGKNITSLSVELEKEDA